MTTTGKLTLYTDRFWISPYVFSCFVALREKELEFESRTVGLDRKEQLLPEYRDASITARVPALSHDAFWLSESSAIVEYLDEAFPDAPRVLPATARERARARQVMAWVRSDLLPLREERPTSTMFYARATQPLTPVGQAAADKLVRVALSLVPERSTILGERFSIADADLAFMLHRLILNGHDVPSRLRAYAEAHWARPSIQAFVARERPPYVAY